MGILLIATSLFNQYLNINHNQYLNRSSLYLCTLAIFALLYFNIKNFINLHPDQIAKNGGYSDKNMYLELVEKLKYE